MADSSSSSSTKARSSSSSSTEARSSSSSSSTFVMSSSSSSTEARSSSSSSSTEARSSSSITSESTSSSTSSFSVSSGSSFSSQSVSSSSTSSSSSLSSFSSSSSGHPVSRPITLPLINQDNGDLIPFSWISEVGAEVSNTVSTVLNFTIEAVNSSYFDYSAIINRDNSAITSTPSVTPTVYVPNSDASKYKHQKSFYVDVIAKDGSGIKDIRTHVDPEKYEFEKAEDAGQVFVIPKFTWS